MAKRLDVGALLGAAVSDSNPMQVHDIPLAAIDENEDNRYDQRNIDELAESIQVVGLQQPLVVQANGERYLLIAGPPECAGPAGPQNRALHRAGRRPRPVAAHADPALDQYNGARRRGPDRQRGRRRGKGDRGGAG